MWQQPEKISLELPKLTHGARDKARGKIRWLGRVLVQRVLFNPSSKRCKTESRHAIVTNSLFVKTWGSTIVHNESQQLQLKALINMKNTFDRLLFCK
jgi:hypothetical protein